MTATKVGLGFLPTPDAVRRKLAETLELTSNLKSLLELSIRVHGSGQVPDVQPTVPTPLAITQGNSDDRR
jgi:hypothetical protein